MHKPFEVHLTPSEQEALRSALVNNYTECRCTPALECAGHKFLSERDRMVGRIDRLLWVRRTLEEWRHAEFTGKCKACGVEAEHRLGADRCNRCLLTAALSTEPEPEPEPERGLHTGPSLPW